MNEVFPKRTIRKRPHHKSASLDIWTSSIMILSDAA